MRETAKHDMTPADWRPYPDRVRSSHRYELKLAEDKKTARPLLAVLARYDTPEEYWRVAMECPKLAYCRKEIENRIHKMQKWREYWDKQKKKKQEVRPAVK